MALQYIEAARGVAPVEGFSRGVRLGPHWELGEISGTDLRGKPEGSTIARQMHRAFQNAHNVLSKLEGKPTLQDATSMTITLANMSDLSAMEQVLWDRFRDKPPARSIVQSELDPDIRFSFTCKGHDLGQTGNRHVAHVPGFSPAGTASAYTTSNPHVWLSQVGANGTADELHEQSVGEQTEAAIRTIAKILENVRSGLTLNDIFRMTIYLKDMTTFKEMNAAYAQAMRNSKPVRAALENPHMTNGANVQMTAEALDPKILQIQRPIITGIPPVIGPYSPVATAGPHVELSGQLPLDAKGKLASHDVVLQTEQVMDNIETILGGVRGDFSLHNAFRLTVVVTSPSDKDKVQATIAKRFPENPPVVSFVHSPLLPISGARVEVVPEAADVRRFA